MNTAIIKHVASAKNNAPAIYCESKSGNVYKLKQQVPLKRHARLISQIRSAKVINIQHWIKVKEGTFIAKPAKAKAPRPEYKEVVVKNQAARIKELQAEVKALKAQLGDAEAAIDSLKSERDSNPVDAPSMAEIAADSAQIRLAEAPSDEAIEEMEIQASIDRYAVSLANKMHKRSAAAKKGWATRRANAQQVAS